MHKHLRIHKLEYMLHAYADLSMTDHMHPKDAQISHALDADVHDNQQYKFYILKMLMPQPQNQNHIICIKEQLFGANISTNHQHSRLHKL